MTLLGGWSTLKVEDWLRQAQSLLSAGTFPQSLTNTLWFNWAPLVFFSEAKDHVTSSHIARELRHRKHPIAFLYAVVFPLNLYR